MWRRAGRDTRLVPWRSTADRNGAPASDAARTVAAPRTAAPGSSVARRGVPTGRTVDRSRPAAPAWTAAREPTAATTETGAGARLAFAGARPPRPPRQTPARTRLRRAARRAGGVRPVPRLRTGGVQARRAGSARGGCMAAGGGSGDPERPRRGRPRPGRAPGPGPPRAIRRLRVPRRGHQPGTVPGRPVPVDAAERDARDVPHPRVHVRDRRGGGPGALQRGAPGGCDRGARGDAAAALRGWPAQPRPLRARQPADGRERAVL